MVHSIHSFWLAKRGNRPEEYEDACAIDRQRGRFALADGASETSYARSWAELLVTGFCQAGSLEPDEWIAPQRERWLGELPQGPLPWYTEVKIEEGAFATFLGVSLESRKRWCGDIAVWNAVAVGDSCVFQVRQGRCIRKFPLQDPAEFDNSPALLGSRTHSAAPPLRRIRNRRCKAGDTLWMMTDALAMWFLQEDAGGTRPWEALAPLLNSPNPEQDFQAWVEARRDEQRLRNDDVTLVAIRC